MAGWDSYVEVRGNRYSVPSEVAGKVVEVRIGLDGRLGIIREDAVVAEHVLKPRSEGWVTVPAHHEKLWQEVLRVERRELSVYEEVARCS